MRVNNKLNRRSVGVLARPKTGVVDVEEGAKEVLLGTVAALPKVVAQRAGSEIDLRLRAEEEAAEGTGIEIEIVIAIVTVTAGERIGMAGVGDDQISIIPYGDDVGELAVKTGDSQFIHMYADCLVTSLLWHGYSCVACVLRIPNCL